MPLGISDRNKMVLWPGCGGRAGFSLHTKNVRSVRFIEKRRRCCCNLSVVVAWNVWFITNGMCTKNNICMRREQAIIDWSCLCAHPVRAFRSHPVQKNQESAPVGVVITWRRFLIRVSVSLRTTTAARPVRGFQVWEAPSVGVFDDASRAKCTKRFYEWNSEVRLRVQEAWNKIASWRAATTETYVFNQEKQVFAKLPIKRSWEFIYQLLEKVNFPLQEIDGIIEKRGNMVDFTCKTRRSAENLTEALSTREEVTFAWVRDPEYTDVKFHWVPSDFPDEKIQGVINILYGDIRYSRILKDWRGKADDRRIYNTKNERLKIKPIPSTVKLSGKRFWLSIHPNQSRAFFARISGTSKTTAPITVQSFTTTSQDNFNTSIQKHTSPHQISLAINQRRVMIRALGRTAGDERR